MFGMPPPEGSCSGNPRRPSSFTNSWPWMLSPKNWLDRVTPKRNSFRRRGVMDQLSEKVRPRVLLVLGALPRDGKEFAGLGSRFLKENLPNKVLLEDST